MSNNGIPGLDPFATLNDVENAAADVIGSTPTGQQALGAASTLYTMLWIVGGVVAAGGVFWAYKAVTSPEPLSSRAKRYYDVAKKGAVFLAA